MEINKCIVKDCQNHKHEGQFIGDICKPCYIMITTGDVVYSSNFIYKLKEDQKEESVVVKMSDEFTQKLIEYLGSECDDYSMTYEILESTFDEDSNTVEVDIKRYDNVVTLLFKYQVDVDDLLIELSEDTYYTTRVYDHSVKYFWMLISPHLFPIKG